MMRLARRYRKLFGGGMRQTGMLAAAGLWALDHHRTDLADDHRRARRLAEAFAVLPGFAVDLDSVETNIVLADTDAPAADVLARLAERGVQMVAFGAHTIRATLHRDLSDADLDDAIEVLNDLFVAR